MEPIQLFSPQGVRGTVSRSEAPAEDGAFADVMAEAELKQSQDLADGQEVVARADAAATPTLDLVLAETSEVVPLDLPTESADAVAVAAANSGQVTLLGVLAQGVELPISSELAVPAPTPAPATVAPVADAADTALDPTQEPLMGQTGMVVPETADEPIATVKGISVTQASTEEVPLPAQLLGTVRMTGQRTPLTDPSADLEGAKLKSDPGRQVDTAMPKPMPQVTVQGQLTQGVLAAQATGEATVQADVALNGPFQQKLRPVKSTEGMLGHLEVTDGLMFVGEKKDGVLRTLDMGGFSQQNQLGGQSADEPLKNALDQMGVSVKEVARQFAERLEQALTVRASGEVKILLDAISFGDLAVTVSLDKGQVEADVQTNHAGLREALAASRHELANAIQSKGFHLADLNVRDGDRGLLNFSFGSQGQNEARQQPAPMSTTNEREVAWTKGVETTAGHGVSLVGATKMGINLVA